MHCSGLSCSSKLLTVQTVFIHNCTAPSTGDFIKHSLTTAQASTFLAWAGLDFRTGFSTSECGWFWMHGGCPAEACYLPCSPAAC